MMNANSNVLFSIKFTELIKESYMEKAKIVNMAGIKFMDGTGSDSYKFNRTGMLTTYEYESDTAPPSQPLKAETVTCRYQPWMVRSPIGDFDIDRMLPDKETAIEKAVKDAIGRRMDQIVLDAFASCTFTNNTFTPVHLNQAIEILGDGSSPAIAGKYDGSEALPLTIAALTKGAAIFDDMGVPSEDRYIIITPAGIRQLLSDDHITSADFNTVRTLVNGEVNTFLGFNFIRLGHMVEGGLPTVKFDTIPGVTAYMFHKDVLGAASSTAPKVVVWRNEEYVQWVVDGRVAAGACIIEQRGVIAIRHALDNKVTTKKVKQEQKPTSNTGKDLAAGRVTTDVKDTPSSKPARPVVDNINKQEVKE